MRSAQKRGRFYTMLLIYLVGQEREEGQYTTLAEIKEKGKQPEYVYTSYAEGDRRAAIQRAAAEVLNSGRISKRESVTIFAGEDIEPAGNAAVNDAEITLSMAMDQYIMKPQIVVGGTLLPWAEKKLAKYVGGTEK